MSLPPSSPNPASLEDARLAIDSIDDHIIELLQHRFSLTQQVKSLKSGEAASWPTPLRPAREMSILRRVLEQADNSLGPELLVRLWRVIFTESTLKQSAINIHVGKKLAQAMGHRLCIRDHFGRIAVEECRDDAQAMVQVNANPSDICIVETASNWIEPYLEGRAGKAQVIGYLPVLKDEPTPKLLVLGVAPAAATGEDETLVISKGNLPRDFSVQPLWQVKTGIYRLSSLAGFYSEHESPLVSLARSNPGLGLKVAGRYASAIEV